MYVVLSPNLGVVDVFALNKSEFYILEKTMQFFINKFSIFDHVCNMHINKIDAL